MTYLQFTTLTLEIVEVYITRSGQVSTTKVHCQLVIDEHPNIIVAAEVKLQTRFLDKRCMRFETELLVTSSVRGTTIKLTLRGPTSVRIIRRNRQLRFSTLVKVGPSSRSLFSTRPSEHTIVRSNHFKVFLNSGGRCITISKETIALDTAVPTRTITKNVDFWNTFRRIIFTKKRAIEYRTFCCTLGTSIRDRFLARVSSKNSRIGRGFYRIETTLNRKSRTGVEVRVKFPLTIRRTMERHVKAALFVHALSIIEEHIKQVIVNKALLTGGAQFRLSLILRNRFIQSAFNNARSNTNTSIHSLLSFLLGNVKLSNTILAAFTTRNIARECRMQFCIRVINNSGHRIRTRTFNTIHFSGTVIVTIVIGLLFFVRDKEQGVNAHIENHIQRNRLSRGSGFPVAVHTDHVFTIFIVITEEHHVIRDFFVKEHIGIPAAHTVYSSHRLTGRATIHTEHGHSRHPFFVVGRNHHKEVLCIRRIRANNGFSRRSRIFVDIKFPTGEISTSKSIILGTTGRNISVKPICRTMATSRAENKVI